MTFAYAPGELAVVCAGSVAVLASIDPQSPLARRLYEKLVSGGTVDDALDVLCSEGLRSVAEFGVLEAQEGGARVVLRGRVLATGLHGVIAHEGGLWREAILGDEVALGLPLASQAPLMPLASGIALAAVMTAWKGDVAASADATAAPVETPLPLETAAALEAPGSEENPGPLEIPPTQPEMTSSNHLEAPASPDVMGSPIAAAVVPGTAVWGSLETPVPHPSDVVTTEAAGDEGEARAEIPEYDSLLSLTMRASDVVPEPPRGPQVPVVAPLDDRGHAPLERDPGATLPAESMESAPYDVALSQSQPTATVGKKLLSAFPWSTGGKHETAPEASHSPAPVVVTEMAQTLIDSGPVRPTVETFDSSDDSEDELEERTVRRSALAGPAGPTVPSTRCSNGHLNPHFAAQCRVCRAPVPAQEPVLAPRPSLGVLRAATGGTIPLERNVILGRNPHLPNGYVGEQPSLIKVSDATKGISTQHAEIRLDGWLVSVRDLGSTNGTEVILPGRPPITLRAHDPLTIEPGTRVILAGVVEYVFEATA